MKCIRVAVWMGIAVQNALVPACCNSGRAGQGRAEQGRAGQGRWAQY